MLIFTIIIFTIDIYRSDSKIEQPRKINLAPKFHMFTVIWRVCYIINKWTLITTTDVTLVHLHKQS